MNARPYFMTLLLTAIVLPYTSLAAARPGERVLLEFDAKHAPPSAWKVQGYAFGTHNPEPEVARFSLFKCCSE